jgi:hypothetical protein
LATITAIRYHDTDKNRWVIATGALCGAATGMVLSALPAFVLIPVMLIVRRDSQIKNRISIGVISVCLGLLVYFATNPYVAIHLINNRELLKANLGNSAAFYTFNVAPAAIGNAIRLMLEGVSPVLAASGIAAIIALAFFRFRTSRPISPAIWLLIVPAAIGAAQFFVFAVNQPSDYGRFALLPDIVLALAAILGAAIIVKNSRWRNIVLIVLFLTTAAAGALYLQRFVRDCRASTSRMREAEALQRMCDSHSPTIAVLAEPAPYNTPPLDVFRWRIKLLPRGADRDPDPDLGQITIHPDDRTIAWADKQFNSIIAVSSRLRLNATTSP